MAGPVPIDPTATVSRAPEQVSTEMAEEIVLLGLRTSRYFGLDGVGASVWKHLAEPRRFDALIDLVTAEYDVEPGQAAADITVFLRELESQGLVEIGPPGE